MKLKLLLPCSAYSRRRCIAAQRKGLSLAKNRVGVKSAPYPSQWFLFLQGAGTKTTLIMTVIDSAKGSVAKMI